MDFVQGDILDKELIRKYCTDADIVHHLAGITDVPRVKSESNESHDKKDKGSCRNRHAKYSRRNK